MTVRRLAPALALVSACGRNPLFMLDAETTGFEASTSTGLSSGTGAASTGASTTGTSTSEPTGPTSTGSGAASVTTGEPTPSPASCDALKDQGMDVSGVATLAHPGEPGQSLDVWCEQGIADGRWMLVARSVAGARDLPFGWTVAAGDLGDDSVPYSLGPVALQFPASQILLAIHDGDKQPVEHIYALGTPAGWPLGYEDASGQTLDVVTVLGDCDPEGSPTMLRWLGYTAATDRYRLRDKQDDLSDVFGLRSDGYNLNYEDCPQGASLDDRQGLLYIR